MRHVLAAVLAVAFIAQASPVIAEPPPEVRELPRDAVGFVHIDLAGLMKQEAVRQVLPLLGEDGSRQLGAPLAEIESLAVVVMPHDVLMVVTTRKAVDIKKARKNLAVVDEEHTYKGKTILAEPDEQGGTFKDGTPRLRPAARALCAAGERTIVHGPAVAVLHHIDTAAPVDAQSGLAAALAVAGRHHVTVGVALTPKRTREAELGLRLDGSPNLIAGLAAYNGKPLLATRQGVLTADVGDAIVVDGKLTMSDASAAQAAEDSVRLLLLLARGGIFKMEDAAGDLFGEMKADSDSAKLLNEARRALAGASLKVDGTSLRIVLRAKIDERVVGAMAKEIAAARQRAVDCAIAEVNLKQIAGALIKHAATNEGWMPASAVYSKDGKLLMSWRVLMLPHVGEPELFRKLKLDEPWDSAHNKPLLARTPKVYQLPGVKAAEGMTFYQLFTGPGTPFNGKKGPRYPASFPDGVAQTVLVVEAFQPVHWAAPDDIDYSPQVSPLLQMGRHYGKGTLAAMADGRVHLIPLRVKERDMHAAITPAGNEVISDSFFAEEEIYLHEKRRREK